MFGSGHSYTMCPSKNTCKSCQKHQHSLLHFTAAATSTATTVSPTTMLVADAVPRSILLSTLLVNIQSTHQETHTFRALLDTGSQVSFITKKCADRLSLARRRCSAQVNAFSGTSVNVVSGNLYQAITSGKDWATYSPQRFHYFQNYIRHTSIKCDIFIVTSFNKFRLSRPNIQYSGSNWHFTGGWRCIYTTYWEPHRRSTIRTNCL